MSEYNRRDVVRAIGAFLPFSLVGASSAPPKNGGAAPPKSGEAVPKGVLDEAAVRDMIASIRPAVVLFEVTTERSTQWGSGFFVSSDGLAITNRHVVRGAQEITCLMKNKDKARAHIVKIDPQYDLALVKVSVDGPVPTVQMGDSEAVEQGLLIGVTGYPAVNWMVWAGVALEASTSRGSVNGMRYGGDINALLGERVLQIDAPVTHGNSGGPVFRMDTGEVIGVLASGSAGEGNLTFAVPINPARQLLSGAGMTVTRNLADPRAPEAVVEAGDLRLLNTINAAKELPPLFGVSFPFTRIVNDRNTQQAIVDWERSTGRAPASVTPMTLNDEELFFGATDGRLRSWNTVEMDDSPVLLDASGDQHIFLSRPVVTNEIICAVAGALDLTSELRDRSDIGSIIGQLFGMGGGKKEHIVVKGQGAIYGLNRRNGSIQWTVPTGFVGTPVLSEKQIYYGGLGVRGCVDSIQGGTKWQIAQKDGDKPDWNHVGYAGKLGCFAVVVPTQGKHMKVEEGGGLRLFARDKARVEAYDPETGKVLWKVDIGEVKDRRQPLNTALFVDEAKGVLYALSVHLVAAIDLNAQKKLWTYNPTAELEKDKNKKAKEAGKRISLSPGMEVQDGILYIGSSDRHLYAINGADGTEIWTYPARGSVGHPMHNDGKIIVGSSDGRLQSVDAKSGALVWRVRTDSPILSQPLVHNGMVYAPTEDGLIHTVRIPTT